MNKSQLQARKTRMLNFLLDVDRRPSYELQKIREEGRHVDVRSRVE